MRNLKRVLSLGVTAAMISGLMIMGTSAAGYDDVTTEDHVEAIEVLQAVGVMVGDENGDFNPDQLVTRNEMAVVMSNLMEYNVATYSGTSPFTDVPSWAEPYVAACWTNGITAGTSATTYGGDQGVTTAQAALMLMKALGYFQYDSDFGADWQLATVAQGNKISLFHDVDSGVREAMTRNDVAQLVLNTLESGMVEADDNILNVDTPDVSVTTGKVDYSYVTSQESYARAIDDLEAVSATSISTRGYIVELGEKLYDGDLRRTEDTTDAYGRPGTQWVYNLDEVGTYADTPIATYTGKVTKGDLYSLVTKARLDDIEKNDEPKDDNGNWQYTFTVYADGKTVVNHACDDDFGDVRGTYFSSNSSAAAGTKDTNVVSGKGVQTEVYLDDDGNLTLVYINTYVMQATADYNEGKDTLNVDVLTNPSDFDDNAKLVNVNQLNGDDFDITGYAEDDYILYTVADDEVEDIYPAEVVSGEVTAYSKESSVTLDGTKYDYAAKIETVDSKPTEYRVGDVAAVVVDQAGYVLYVDSAAISLGNYLYVDAVINGTGFNNSQEAKVYFTDGTTANVDINNLYTWDGKAYDKETKWEGVTASESTTTSDFDGWYSYSVNSSDEYTLREAKTNDFVTVSGNDALEGDKVQFAAGVRGNSDTVLIVNDDDDITVYTGVRNFPSIDANDEDIVIHFFKEKDNASNTYAAVAYVDATNAVLSDSTDTLLYVLDQDSSYVDNADNETVYVYNAILEGELTTIESKVDMGDMYTLFTNVRVDGDGYYELDEMEEFDGSIKNDEYFEDDLVYSTDEDAGLISVSGDSLMVSGKNGSEEFVITSDTQINVVLYPDGSRNNDIGDLMDDEDADYEVHSLTGRQLNNMVDGYGLDGCYYVVTEDDDSTVATVVYIVIERAEAVED